MAEQHSLCYEIATKRYENLDRIHEMILWDGCRGLDDHDTWLEWCDELWDRINWLVHLTHQMDRSYLNEHFEPDKVRLSLYDYIMKRSEYDIAR